eukprot:TRINITY_DN23577_c0_g1_i1.p1 TRINITY_DN23577_c0_g1~~TRINITY_DN23577_c0_g1_i1.p1  ORF type:complete len:955 (+),score=184.98 TRINITY_DN23577_c0_g1_i1:109-2865(+)
MAGADMLNWTGEEAKLLQLCQLFELACVADNNIQKQVMEQLNQFSQLEDFTLYLVTIFAKMTNQSEVVRQRAGLLLKTNLNRQGFVLSMPVASYVQAHALMAVRDPNRVIRHTAGTVITSILQKLGMEPCLQTLNQLADCLRESNPDVVEGCFSALNKICEDGVTMLKQFWNAPPEHTQCFVSWCSERLLPRVIEYANPCAALVAKRNAIECLNHFALNWMFSDEKYFALNAFASKYVEVLGVLASDADKEVLRHVCKGFVCVIENNWPCLAPPSAQVVLTYMLKASRHPEYVVRQEALEVWTPCTNSMAMLQLVKPMLGELVPVLLANMVYTDADYFSMDRAQIDEDNAGIPDTAEDMAPCFHKGEGRFKDEGQDDDDEGGVNNPGGAWGAEWTARKAAASSLDHLAVTFKQEMLEVVLPLIQQKLEDSSWEVQESGVLALGAIAIGCMEGLVKFLPRVLELLLRLSQAPKPLLRTISCWCTSRFSWWICDEHTNPNHEQALRSVLGALLQRVLDKNKLVQEAGCSALATLQEEARIQLVPYLDEIVKTLSEAFRYYQAKNLLILYDAVGTLADCVHKCLDRPQYMEALVVPLMHKFDTVLDNDRSLIPLFQCLSRLMRYLAVPMLPIIPKIVERCVRLVLQGANAAQMAQQNPNEYEKPDREVTVASIDLLAGVIEGLCERTSEILSQRNFMQIVPEVLKDNSLQVKQSAFALVGDCATYCIEYLAPFFPQIFPFLSKCINDNSSATVTNNASWAIGEICVKVSPDVMTPYLEHIVPPLANILIGGRGAKTLLSNVCITLARLGLVCGAHMGKSFGTFARPWCVVMKGAAPDDEKINAFQGLGVLIKANPQACLDCFPELAGAIGSFFVVPAQLQPLFHEILHSYKQTFGARWPEIHQQFPDDVKSRLQHLYGLTA